MTLIKSSECPLIPATLSLVVSSFSVVDEQKVTRPGGLLILRSASSEQLLPSHLRNASTPLSWPKGNLARVTKLKRPAAKSAPCVGSRGRLTDSQRAARDYGLPTAGLNPSCLGEPREIPRCPYLPAGPLPRKKDLERKSKENAHSFENSFSVVCCTA